MQKLKTILVVVIGVLLPFALLGAGMKIDKFSGVFDAMLFLYPVYLPVLCSWAGINIYKVTNKILLPTVIFNMFLIATSLYLSQMIFNSIERSLADVVIAVLLYGPLFYSVLAAPISAVIYKRKIKRKEMQE